MAGTTRCVLYSIRNIVYNLDASKINQAMCVFVHCSYSVCVRACVRACVCVSECLCMFVYVYVCLCIVDACMFVYVFL